MQRERHLLRDKRLFAVRYSGYVIEQSLYTRRFVLRRQRVSLRLQPNRHGLDEPAALRQRGSLQRWEVRSDGCVHGGE